METADQEIYYQKIKEMIFDEDKIITPFLLINDLKLSISDVKLLLKSFLKDQQTSSKSSTLGVTFVLSGLLNGENKLCISLCKEDELIEKRKLFSKIASEDVYSIQKKNNIDFTSIALTNDGSNNSLNNFEEAGFVLSKNTIKRDLKRKQVEEVTPTPPAATTSKKHNFFQKLPSNQKQQPVQSAKEKELAKPAASKTNGLSNFLSKASLEDKSKNKENKNVQPKNEPAKPEKKEQKVDKPEKMDEDEPKAKIEPKSVKSKSPANKKRKKAAKEENPAKKRKRIQEICDSDSSDMFGSENETGEDDVIENSFEETKPEPVKEVKPVENLPLVKGRRRKAVDKTYKDEEGFLVTTTEYVYETASEDDEPLPPPKPTQSAKSNGVGKKNSTTDSETDTKDGAKKGKNAKKKAAAANQPSIMNFFKKK